MDHVGIHGAFFCAQSRKGLSINLDIMGKRYFAISRENWLSEWNTPLFFIG